jgi:hypothetical protein
MSGESYPLTGIAEPGANDVLCGRGGASNNHIGNRRFRMLVNEHRMRYKSSCKLDKPKVAREIMMIWRNQTPPGRFLCKVAGTKLWDDVGDQKAREKASQCLRERDPGNVPSLLPANEGKRNSMLSHNLLYEHDLESPNDLSEEPLSAIESCCAKSDHELLPEKLQRDFHEQQHELIKIHLLQRKVEKMLLQQQNFTKLWSELTQDALQRQDQQQLHRVQWDLLRRREKLEQQQLALIRAIKLTVSEPCFPGFSYKLNHKYLIVASAILFFLSCRLICSGRRIFTDPHLRNRILNRRFLHGPQLLHSLQ